MSDSYERDARDAAARAQSNARRGIDEAKDAIPAFGDAARSAADAVLAAGRKASSVMSDLTDDARDTGAFTRDQFVSQVREQPMAAVLIAAALGLIAGLFLSRN
jgi:ElaB/YqjD/DUF883 family membrane-anchored ribosome-binding protein